MTWAKADTRMIPVVRVFYETMRRHFREFEMNNLEEARRKNGRSSSETLVDTCCYESQESDGDQGDGFSRRP